MSKRGVKPTKEWSRCSEGFSDFLTEFGIKQPEEKKTKPMKDDFSHGNIFEKLAFHSEEISQGISWSSSDEELKTTKTANSATKPVVKKSCSGQRQTPSIRRKRKKTGSPRTRNVRGKLNSVDNSEVLEIHSGSDTELVNSYVPSPKSSETAIKAFDSETDDAITQQTQQTQVLDSQESPSIADSASSTSPVTQTGSCLKASDWVKTLQLKTPSKSEYQPEMVQADDSVRKKKKPSRGSLADRLSRLQARDKSSVRMWSHQQSKVFSQDSKAVALEVVGFESLYSLQAVRCVTLPSQTSDSDTLSDTGSTSGEERLVMFPVAQVEQLSLQIGSRFKVFPPWQQLELRNGCQALLCTKYCQITHQPDDEASTKASTLTQGEIGNEIDKHVKPSCSEDAPSKTVKLVWNCPCVQGLCRKQTLCPAYQFPTVAGWIQVPESGKTDGNSNEVKHSTEKKSSEKSSSHLRTFSCKTESGMNDNYMDECVFDSLIESIESGRTLDSEMDNGNSKVFCFKGYIHKAVWYREVGGRKSCRLLVEDMVGTICEIRLTQDALKQTDLSTVERNTFQFSGLQVWDRITREKNPCLFSLLDSVWSGRHCRPTSQENDFSQDCPKELNSGLPGYCYILGTGNQLNGEFQLEPCPKSTFEYKEPVYRNLSDICDMSAVPARCTCVTRVVYIHSLLNGDFDFVTYVTDSSLSVPQSYVKIHIESACDFSHDSLAHDGSNQLFCLLRDLYVDKDKVFADGYSKIIKLPKTELGSSPLLQDTSSLQCIQVKLPDLTQGAQLGDLYEVTGSIEEVDEDSAYSWEVCIKCGSDQLQEPVSDSLTKCLKCKHLMVDSKTMMKMEVLVQCDKLDNLVKIDLLQKTIEKLLPADGAEEEGYDLSDVLNKTVGPVTCIVNKLESDNQQGQLYLKEIQT